MIVSNVFLGIFYQPGEKSEVIRAPGGFFTRLFTKPPKVLVTSLKCRKKIISEPFIKLLNMTTLI